MNHPRTAHESVMLRKANAVAQMLHTVPVAIDPGELLVGVPFGECETHTVAEDAAPRREPPPAIPPGESYIAHARGLLSAGQVLVPYSPDLLTAVATPSNPRYGQLPEYATDAELLAAARVGLTANNNPGHLQAGHARVVAQGWTGLRQRAAAQLATLDAALPGNIVRADFLRSVMITLDGACGLAMRYADLATSLAAAASAPGLQAELSRIAEVCCAVASGPPATFRQALQLHWFTHLIAVNQGAKQLGRFDQYMYPFMAADLAAGRLDLDEARELLKSLWRKYAQITAVTEDNLQNMIVGGQTANGADATNELTHMCLEVTAELGLVDPKLSVRLHRESPDGLVRRTAELIAAGQYQPGIYNDETIIPALTAAGVTLEHARDYTNDGCSELLVQGRTNPWCFEAKVHLLKCLERVMFRLTELDSFAALYAAVVQEITMAVEMATGNTNLLQQAVPRISPNPFVSATVEGCLERMLDLTEGGALYNPASVCASGLADTADALAAVRKLVYEDEVISRSELVRALAAGFTGYERLRLLLLNRAPKFGNNDDQVDDLAVDLVRHLARCVQGRRNPRGGPYVLGLFSYGDYIAQGLLTGATPDGRLAGAGISPNFSPSPGRDRQGPFAVLQSTAKIPPELTPSGRAVDVAVHRSAFAGPAGPAKAAGLLQAFVASGEMQMQLNVLDAELLRQAQLDPESHRNLTVRLWGFPAHFVGLPREFQDHLIARSMHRSG